MGGNGCSIVLEWVLSFGRGWCVLRRDPKKNYTTQGGFQSSEQLTPLIVSLYSVVLTHFQGCNINSKVFKEYLKFMQVPGHR